MHRCLVHLLFLLILFSFEANAFEGWAHLELGAGNYGADGHTKASQAMTVLLKIKNVSAVRNYIDDLEESGHGCYNPEEQYGVLFWTLDELIRRYGAKGIFHVNDLYEEYAVFAAEKLREYATAKGYGSVVIEVIPGDYQFLDSEKTLAQWGKEKYSSVHLKNPEISFYYDTMDGDDYSSSEESRRETRMLLQHLADLSEKELYLFILYHDDFVPREERAEFIEKDIFYHPTAEWEPVRYTSPEGILFPEGEINVGKVYAIGAAEVAAKGINN